MAKYVLVRFVTRIHILGLLDSLIVGKAGTRGAPLVFSICEDKHEIRRTDYFD